MIAGVVSAKNLALRINNHIMCSNSHLVTLDFNWGSHLGCLEALAKAHYCARAHNRRSDSSYFALVL